MKHQNMTFSIPEDLKVSLNAHVASRGVSRFISDAIRKALEDEIRKREIELDKAYEAANSDVDRLNVLHDWDQLNDLVNEEEDWEWLKESTGNKKKKK